MIRVQSPDGTKRVEVSKENLAALYEKIFKEFKIEGTQVNEWSLYLDRNRSSHIPNTKNTPVTEVISHGDMIYLLPETTGKIETIGQHVEEDDVDKELIKQDGKINRGRDEQLYIKFFYYFY